MRKSSLAVWLPVATLALLVSLLLVPLIILLLSRTATTFPDKRDGTLDEAIAKVQALLLRGDDREVQAFATQDGWKQIYSCYDFQVTALGFKGTLSDYLRQCGTAIQSSSSPNVIHTSMGEGKVVFFFDRTMPEGVTIALCHMEGRWRIVYLSPGQIDPKSIFP